MNPVLEFEKVAVEQCRCLVEASPIAMQQFLEDIAVLAFTFGVAWAMDKPEMIELARAQIEALRARRAS